MVNEHENSAYLIIVCLFECITLTHGIQEPKRIYLKSFLYCFTHISNLLNELLPFTITENCRSLNSLVANPQFAQLANYGWVEAPIVCIKQVYFSRLKFPLLLNFFNRTRGF